MVLSSIGQAERGDVGAPLRKRGRVWSRPQEPEMQLDSIDAVMNIHHDLDLGRVR
jgi:hypothetical protein